MDVLPAWAEALFREKLGASPLTRVEVLKDTPFHKILVGYTATSAVLAEKGLLGRNAYLLPTAVVNPGPATPAPPTTSPAAEEENVREVRAAKKQRPKPRRAPPVPKDPPAKPKVNRGKVAPRRKPAAKPQPEEASAPPAPAPATPPPPPRPTEAPESPAPEPPRPRAPAPTAAAPPKGRPVELIEGIGPTYVTSLHALGVRTAEDLIRADAAALAAKADLTPELVAKWQALATLQQVDVIGPQSSELLVRAGLRDLRSLAEETPESLAKRLSDYESGLGLRVQNLAITPELCAGWIQGARETLERPRGT